VRSVVDERTPTYTEAADLIVDVDRLRPGRVADEIVRQLELPVPEPAEA
jgi:hypothetical protein